jgi:hypothetical protein
MIENGLYKTCIALAQRWLAHSLQSGSSSVPPKKIGDPKKKLYALRFPIYHQLPFHGMLYPRPYASTTMVSTTIDSP